MTRAEFMRPNASSTDWVLDQVTRTLPFLAYCDPTLIVASPSAAVGESFVLGIPPDFCSIEARNTALAAPQLIKVDPPTVLRLSIPFFSSGHTISPPVH